MDGGQQKCGGEIGDIGEDRDEVAAMEAPGHVVEGAESGGSFHGLQDRAGETTLTVVGLGE